MAYIVYSYPDNNMVTSGLTREQLLRALFDNGLTDIKEKIPALPRFGKEVLIIRHANDQRVSFVIRHK